MHDLRLGICDVPRDSRHVCEECCAGEHDWIVPHEASEREEEDVKIEIEANAMFATPFEHFESQKPDQARGIDGNGNVCQADEECHDIEWSDMVGAHSAITYFCPSNGGNGKEEQVGNDWRREEVHGEPHSYELAMISSSVSSRTIIRRDDSSSLQ